MVAITRDAMGSVLEVLLCGAKPWYTLRTAHCSQSNAVEV